MFKFFQAFRINCKAHSKPWIKPSNKSSIWNPSSSSTKQCKRAWALRIPRNLHSRPLQKNSRICDHQLDDARAKLTDEHPDVIALKEKIANAEKIKKEMETERDSQAGKAPDGVDSAVAASVERGGTTPMMQVQSQIKSINLEIQNYNQRVKDLESQISTYRNRLNLTPQTEQQLAEVSRGYEESKANYNSLLQKQNQSQLATSLEQRQQGQQFRILDPPNLPNRPSAPNHLLLSLAGLLAGAGLGLGLAAYLELRNALVRQEKDLDGLIPTRVLVGIPHLKVPGEDRVQAMTRRLEIGAFAVMALLLLAGNLYALYKG